MPCSGPRTVWKEMTSNFSRDNLSDAVYSLRSHATHRNDEQWREAFPWDLALPLRGVEGLAHCCLLYVST
jgi:hypothetical protein